MCVVFKAYGILPQIIGSLGPLNKRQFQNINCQTMSKSPGEATFFTENHHKVRWYFPAFGSSQTLSQELVPR